MKFAIYDTLTNHLLRQEDKRHLLIMEYEAQAIMYIKNVLNDNQNRFKIKVFKPNAEKSNYIC